MPVLTGTVVRPSLLACVVVVPLPVPYVSKDVSERLSALRPYVRLS